MILGAAGTALIRSFETLRLVAYRDQRGVLTIGWGHTIGVQPGQVCSIEQAECWFQADVGATSRVVTAAVDVAITQNQFDALVSFAYNVGGGAFHGSTLLRLLNGGNFTAAADAFLEWNHVDGVVDDGLTRRRAAERALFLGLS